jgi:hypothetical protein
MDRSKIFRWTQIWRSRRGNCYSLSKADEHTSQ